MHSLINMCLNVILDTYYNIEKLLDLLLGTYERNRILNSLRIKTISRVAVDESVAKSISSVNENKLRIYEKLVKKLRNVEKQGGKISSYESADHIYNIEFDAWRLYAINLLHIFKFKVDGEPYTFYIQNPKEKSR